MIKQKVDSVFYSESFKRVLQTNKVKRIALFGSHAAGKVTRMSDIDFLVEFEQGADLLDQVGLKLDLEKLLKKTVDVVTPKALSRHIRPDVLRQAVEL